MDNENKRQVHAKRPGKISSIGNVRPALAKKIVETTFGEYFVLFKENVPAWRFDVIMRKSIINDGDEIPIDMNKVNKFMEDWKGFHFEFITLEDSKKML